MGFFVVENISEEVNTFRNAKTLKLSLLNIHNHDSHAAPHKHKIILNTAINHKANGLIAFPVNHKLRFVNNFFYIGLVLELEVLLLTLPIDNAPNEEYRDNLYRSVEIKYFIHCL